MDAQDSSVEDKVTVKTFKSSGYQEITWPIVESQVLEATFAPLAFELVKQGEFAVDALFEVFEPSAPGISHATVIVEQDLQENELYDVAMSVDYRDEALVGVGDGGVSVAARIEEEVEKRVSARMLQDAEARAAELTQAREEAFAQGADSIKAEIADLKNQLSARFDELCDDMRTQIVEARRDYEQQAVDLALQVAQKLLEKVVEVDRSYIEEILAQALRAAGGAEVVSVRVSPQDYEFLATRRLSEGATEKWPIQSDDSIRSGCIVTTNAGEVDFDLEKSWARIRDRVLKGPKL